MRRHGMVALVFCLAVAALTAAGISGSGPNAASIALAEKITLLRKIIIKW